MIFSFYSLANEANERMKRMKRTIRTIPTNVPGQSDDPLRYFRIVALCSFLSFLFMSWCFVFVFVFAKRKFRLLMLFYIIHNVLLTVSAYCLRIVKIKTPTTTTNAFKQKQPHQLKTDVISPRFFDRNVAPLLQRQSYQPTNTFPFLPSINRCRIFYLFLFPLSAKRKKYNI